MIISIIRNQDKSLFCKSINTGPAWSYGKRCRTTAYVTISGVPFCKKHANRHVLNLIVDGEAQLHEIII